MQGYFEIITDHDLAQAQALLAASGLSLPAGRTYGLGFYEDGHLAACGFTLFDTQYPTPHLQSLGGLTIPRAEYRRRLAEAIRKPADITASQPPSPLAVLNGLAPSP